MLQGITLLTLNTLALEALCLSRSRYFLDMVGQGSGLWSRSSLYLWGIEPHVAEVMTRGPAARVLGMVTGCRASRS